ncbi:MAG: hypothetical protein CL927_16570 [Deltaproteobacteria bacterium]|nr:hypothetical protein [Deltaproteobacteria bacterium]HCH62468.1 hypothetical protein [Deltaproteobacteria bacterium]
MRDVDAPFPARVWLRVDALQPLSCSVRFAMLVGEGRLSWGAVTPMDARPTMRNGTAAGLSASDLSAMSLAVQMHGQSERKRLPLHLTSLPPEGRLHVGTWIELDVSQTGREGSTEIFIGFDPADVDPSGVSTGERPMLELPTESSTADPPWDGPHTDSLSYPTSSLTESLPRPGETGPLGRSSHPGDLDRSSLVRALVQRIRVQDEALKSLRDEVALLRAQLGRPQA